MLRILFRKVFQITVLFVMLLHLGVPFDSGWVQAAHSGSGSRAAVVKIAAGSFHNLALKSDGSVVAWGRHYEGQTNVPAGLNGVVSIAAGSQHSIALKSDGSVVAWGNNSYGQTTVPTEAQTGVAAIAAGTGHSMALKSDGSVVAWGNNNAGQSTVPAGLSGVVAIAAGGSHSLALKSDGTVVAWGGNTNGQTTVPTEAQTGVATIAAGTDHSLALKSDGSVVAWGDNGFGQSTVPAGLNRVVAITAGRYHTLALKPDGSVVAWGNNSYGQTTVATGAQTGVVAIAAGTGGSLALKSDGSVVAWGNNSYGETTVPAAIASPVKANRIAAGTGHSMALKSDGSVVAWGNNSAGQTTVPAGLSGVAAIAAGGYHSLALKSDGSVVAWGYNSFGQTNVPAGLNGVVAIAGGGAHSLALKSDGSVVAWGINYNGETTVPAGLSGVVAIAAGDSHSLALKSDGTVVAWGGNIHGQTNVPAGLSGVAAIAAGSAHSLALKSDGSVVAWGYNGSGQTNVPAGLSDVVAIAAGGYHSLALKSDGSVVAWGENSDGQTTVPTGAQTGVVAIAGGDYHSLALKSDGSVLAWGDNSTVPGSSDLTGLTINMGALNPNFNASVSYTTYVGGSVSSVNVTATLADTINTSLWIDGQVQSSGVAAAVSLTGTSTIIPVRVSPYLLPDKLYLINVIQDSTAPNVSFTVTKADGSAYSDNTWTNQAVSVTAGVTDDVSVTSITYSLNGGASWNPYSSPIQLSGDGVHSLSVKAIDSAGNETVALRTVNISSSGLRLTPTLTSANGAPYTSGAWTKQSVTASVYAESGASGIASISYTLNGGTEQAYMNNSPVLFNQEGMQAIVFKLTDTAGNMLNAPLAVNIDKTRPVITLNGPSSVMLTAGETYIELGAAATDNVGLAGAVTITGTVTTSVAGTYTLRYHVSDFAGNTAEEAVRTVVVDPTPTTSGGGGSTNTVTMSVIDQNGVSLDPNTIDTTKPSVTLEITPKDGVAYLSLPASILTGIAGKNADFIFEIKTSYGSYQIPVNLAALIPGLTDLLSANNLKAEDISFKITLTDKSGSKDIQAAFANALPNGIVMGAIVDFSMEIINTKTGRTIETADKFSKALTRVIPMPKNMTDMPRQWGAFRHNETTKKLEFVPARKVQIDGAWYGMISSYSNSIYVVAQNAVSFADVQTHWSQSFVDTAAAKELVDGVGGGEYAPDRALTRAEFTAMLVRALGRGTSAGSTAPYDDVKPDAWYFDVATKAKELDLVDFVSGKSFMPDQPLTREEVASMLAAVITLEKLPITNEFINLDGYKDIGSVDAAYLEDVRMMVKLNIMTGTGADMFSPKGETTRAQAAVVLIRTLQMLGWMD